MNLDIPTINSRLVSSVQKREVMWNIIEPGDPYDIRKSMIARLPGQKNYMGDHLELVCLLQAAEIERLCEYLDQYKLKFREVERRELDRHSYEVQIKELTMRISDEGNFKAENLKLREFLRKQSAEFEELKKKFATSGYEAELVRKYEESLRQAESYLRENESLRESLGKLRQDHQLALNSLEELQRRVRDSSGQSGRGQAYYKLEIEFKKLEFENKRIREINDSKNREIEELQARSKQFVYQLEEQSTQIRQYSNVSSTLKEYQNRFSLFGQEIERLNLVLRDKSAELSEATGRCRSLEEERRRQGQYVSDLEKKRAEYEELNRQLEYRLLEAGSQFALEESRGVLKTYEGNMEKLSLQIQRLNSVLRKKVGQLQEANHRLAEQQFQLRRGEEVRREVENFRQKFGEFNRKMADYENKIALLSQEVERLNQALKRKGEEATTFEHQARSRLSQIENLQKQASNLQIEYKSQISYLTASYEGRIVDLNRENQSIRGKQMQEASVAQSRSMQAEVDKLTLLITNKNAEIERLQSDLLLTRQRDSTAGVDRQRVAQYESEINAMRQQNEQLRGGLEEYQRRIILLSQQIERLNFVLERGNSPSRKKSEEQLEAKKYADYENKILILSQEIERLNEMRAKQGRLRAEHESLLARETQTQAENERLREDLRIAQQNLNRKNSDQQISISVTKEQQIRIRQLSQENTQIARRASELEYQVGVLTHEVERLNGVLTVRVEATEMLEQRIRGYSKESDELRRKLAESENKLGLLAQESERIKSNQQMSSQFQIENYRRRLSDQEKRLTELEAYSREIETKLRNSEQQTRSTLQETDSLRSSLNEANRKHSDYENKIVLLSREIERLNELLEKFNAENQEQRRKLFEADQLKSALAALEQRVARASQENQELRKRLNEGQQSKTKLNQDYQSRLRQLQTEKEQLLRRVHEQQSKHSYTIQELEHANSVVKDRTEKVTMLENKIRSQMQQNEGLLRKVQEFSTANRRIAEFESKVALLSQEIQRLNGILRSKVEELGAAQNKCSNYEIELTNYQRKLAELETGIARDLQTKNGYLARENEELKVRIRQLSLQVGKIPDIQNKFALTLGEVERLNSTLRAKMEQISSYTAKVRSLEQELDRGKRKAEELEATMHRQLKGQSGVFEQRVSQLSEENEVLRKSVREFSDVNRRIPELENKIAILSTQIERLNEVLGKYSRELLPELEERNRRLAQENDDLRRKCSQLGEASKAAQQTLGKLRIAMQQNEQNIRRIQEYESRMTQISGEVERLNGVLRMKVEELGNSDAKIRQVVLENEQISKRLRQVTETSRRLPEYESKLALLGQEIERLNGIIRTQRQQGSVAQNKLRMTERELEGLQRRAGELQAALNEQRKQRSVLEQKAAILNTENEQMRRSLRDLADSNRRLAQYESRITLLSQQVERLNMNLRMKSDELSASENMLRSYRKETQIKLQSVSAELEDYRRKTTENMGSQASRLAEYESKMVILSKEIQRLNIVLKQTSFELEGSQNRERQCVQQIQRLNNTLRLKVEQAARWEQVNADLKNKLRIFEENLNVSNAQFEKLKYQHGLLAEQYKKSNQHLVEYEQSINKLYQEFERLQSIIQSLKKENYELKVRLQEAGNLAEKNRVLSAEIDRLTRLVEQQTIDLEDLRLALSDQVALQKRVQEYMALMVVLFAEIQSLRKRVKDTEKEIESVRRSSLAPFKI